MTNSTSLSFSIEIIEVMAVKVWNNPSCHNCLFEWSEACKLFDIHRRSSDTHCLFCINNPNAVLPMKNQHRSAEMILEAQR